MSDLPHFTQASEQLTKEYTKALAEAARELGCTGSTEDRVEWSEVNQRMVEWWKQQGYHFP